MTLQEHIALGVAAVLAVLVVVVISFALQRPEDRRDMWLDLARFALRRAWRITRTPYLTWQEDSGLVEVVRVEGDESNRPVEVKKNAS